MGGQHRNAQSMGDFLSQSEVALRYRVHPGPARGAIRRRGRTLLRFRILHFHRYDRVAILNFHSCQITSKICCYDVAVTSRERELCMYIFTGRNTGAD